ncbi:hypothetical protein PI124_g6322 [Phytophthora idaei]|nr:hypothetical protein PI125_g18665 [Phytophthora idaei]KAG3173181.1 hypothetical protein PI126_g973 [Phytophthora idaei]KAG3249010.1 hypothetical protein PI124_g6322 [Phytophthora idaei]
MFSSTKERLRESTSSLATPRRLHALRSSDILLEDSVELLVVETLLESDIDEDEQSRRGGSRPGKLPNVDRQAELYASLLFQDYFSESPIYSEDHFRRRFHMHRSLFTKIASGIGHYDTYSDRRLIARSRWA